jgi:predicted flap endonuclease-1-like 5' DNA nuclease
MQDEILVLKTRNQRLEAGGEPDLAFQPEKPEPEEGDMVKAFEILSAQLRELQQSNKQISEELKVLKSGKDGPSELPESETSFQPQPIFEIEPFDRTEDPADGAPEEPPQLPEEHIPEERVPLQEPQEDHSHDDLTRIEGIGPFLQQKLFDLNITTFQQIASLTSQDVQTLTQKIGYIPGRIEKDDWVGQARSLMATTET